MERCAATDLVLLRCSLTIPSMSATDYTAHRDSLLALSLAFWRAYEGLVATKKGIENG